RRALERLDRIGQVAEPPVGLADPLGPLRVVGLQPLELEVSGQGALVLAGRDRRRGLLAQCSTVLGHRWDTNYRVRTPPGQAYRRGARRARARTALGARIASRGSLLACGDQQIAGVAEVGLGGESPQLVVGVFRSRQRSAVLGDGLLEIGDRAAAQRP